MSNINWELVSMEIIANVGYAKSNAIMAIDLAKKSKFNEASKLIEEANEKMVIAERQHMDIIVAEAQGVQHPFKVLFIHAEDQMLTTQVLIKLSEEFIEIYKIIKS